MTASPDSVRAVSVICSEAFTDRETRSFYTSGQGRGFLTELEVRPLQSVCNVGLHLDVKMVGTMNHRPG